MELNLSYMSISDLLEKSAEKNELIYVRERQRCLGKTASLIQFARKNNCPILMNRNVASHFQYIHPDLEFIAYYDGKRLDGLENVVCDEGIPFDVVKDLHSKGCLLTGFVRRDNVPYTYSLEEVLREVLYKSSWFYS
ncbi:hypothetical protein MOD54_12400 [Bacillus spizizenii]|nr:hypothetical protein [Bacillus spizizenii]MCY8110273.1 hypothetical protein [Bacillus spizizenii]MCY8303411.1 hypothetical protein [Bacillus spizizenii]MCY8659727.1 hypothetical protein [Bacillus spizizenii]MCY8687358.1 hypothetical protein [Bacillus spizizenii]